MSKGRLLLLDASIYIFRYYFSLPPHWESACGNPTETVYGYLAFLLRLLEEQQPSYIAAAYDESLESCFRNDLYPDYKANRALPDKLLAFQLAACVEGAKLLGIPCYSSDRYEADDIIGTLAEHWRRSQFGGVAILSRDKDLGQLVGEQDCLWDYGYADPQCAADLQARLGVAPEQIPDYLALVGDSVDNIPGVPGIGGKTAVALLAVYPTVEAMLRAGDQVAALPIRGAGGLPAKLTNYAAQIGISKQLATVHCKVPLGHRPARIATVVARQSVDVEGFAAFAEAMGLGRLASRAAKLGESL